MALDFPGGGSNIQDMAEPTLTVTPRAAKRIQEIIAGKPKAALRVAVNGGGCSGFQYQFAIADERQADDLAVEQDGVTVLVDSVSMGFLAGAVLDFEDTLMGQQFKVQNPMAKSSCGCGTSFSI
jgi:iron-sulfur cluster assembly accessory protein